MKKIISLVLIFLVFVSFGFSRVIKANKTETLVRMEYRVVNKTDKTIDFDIYIAVPQSNERQEVVELYYQDGYKDIIKDIYGNKILHYKERNVKPQEVRIRGWFASAVLYAVVYKEDRNAKLGNKDRILYLRDDKNYQLTNPVILELKNKIIDKKKSDYANAMNVFEYLINNINYYRDDKWDTAPEVLEKKQGSCSEYNFAFISVLRASGIPARYTGAIMYRMKTGYDKKVGEDAVFHRWTEIFLNNKGWLPFDASRGSGSVKRHNNYYNFIARLSSDALQTYRGDGGEKGYLNWDYIGTTKAKLKDSFKESPCAFWIDYDRTKLKPYLKEMSSFLKTDYTPDSLYEKIKDLLKREILFFLRNEIKRDKYPVVAKALYKVKHPSSIYFYLNYKGSLNDIRKISGDYLFYEIAKFFDKCDFNRSEFEYWWRMARKFIKYDNKTKKFILTNKNINIY